MYEVTKDFKGSNYGWDVVEYTKGQVVELSEDLAAVALKEKWVKRSPRKSEAELAAEAAAAAAEAERQAAERATALAAADEKVAAAQAALDAADDEDKPAAQAALDAATTERAALG